MNQSDIDQGQAALAKLEAFELFRANVASVIANWNADRCSSGSACSDIALYLHDLSMAMASAEPVAKGQVWRFTDGSRWKVEDIHQHTVGLRRLPESGNPDVGYLEWHKDMREHTLEAP